MLYFSFKIYIVHVYWKCKTFLKYSLRKNTLFYMYTIFQNYHIKKMTKYNIITGIRNSEFSLHKSPPFYFQAKQNWEMSTLSITH